MSRMKRCWTESTRKANYYQWWRVANWNTLASLKDIMLVTMPGLGKQGGQRKEWPDDLVEWTGKTTLCLVWKAFQRCVYEVAHTRASGTAPWLIECEFTGLAKYTIQLPVCLVSFKLLDKFNGFGRRKQAITVNSVLRMHVSPICCCIRYVNSGGSRIAVSYTHLTLPTKRIV